MNNSLVILILSLLLSTNVLAQWGAQHSGTTVNLRGVHAVSSSVAWASGAEGTVLRTENGGTDWLRCSTPHGAERLDFRGIWAWDAKSAMVLASGPGDQSRIYETKDGCLHWNEMAKNSDKDGFWDAMTFQAGDFGSPGDEKTGILIGDPVHDRFYTMAMMLGHGWSIDDAPCAARAGEAAFAASNTSAFVFGTGRYILVTGGTPGPRALLSGLLASRDSSEGCLAVTLPLAAGSDSAGAFSVFFSDARRGVAVGGDYKKPDQSSGTAAFTSDGGYHWTAASKPPHGYRSAVAWYADGKVWIAAGTNGSDISRDGGKTWEPMDNANWNALSLPYVVGPKGSIAKLPANAFGRQY